MAQKTIIIPATSGASPGVVRENVAGRYFTTISATNAYKLRVGRESEIDQSNGRSYGSETSPEFDYLTFYNFAATPCTVTYYYGQEYYKGDPSTTAAPGTFNVTATPKDTYTNAFNLTVDTNLSGLDASNKRKSLIVQNRGGQSIEVKTSVFSGFVIAPGDPAFQIESGGLFSIAFTGAGAKDARILETFYLP